MIERLVKRAYEAQGYLVIRSPQSGNAMDLTCLPPVSSTDTSRVDTHPDGCVQLVQVKSRGYLRPGEKAELLNLAQQHGCIPVLAWATATGPIYRRELIGGSDLAVLANPDKAPRPDPAGLPDE